jgi:hypothetical protein
MNTKDDVAMEITNARVWCGCGSAWPKSTEPCPKCGAPPVAVYAYGSAELTRLQAIERAAREVVAETPQTHLGEVYIGDHYMDLASKLSALRLALASGK